MADQADENLVLEQLRGIRKVLADIRQAQHETTNRLASLERHQALFQTDLVEVRAAVDRLGNRIGRIEERLELRDAPEPPRSE